MHLGLLSTRRQRREDRNLAKVLLVDWEENSRVFPVNQLEEKEICFESRSLIVLLLFLLFTHRQTCFLVRSLNGILVFSLFQKRILMISVNRKLGKIRSGSFWFCFLLEMFSNSTHFYVQSVFLGFGMFVLVILTIIGNTIVIYAIRTDRHLRTVK